MHDKLSTYDKARWVSTGELAEHLGVSVWSIRRGIKMGRFVVAEPLPGLIRIDLRSVPIGRTRRDRSGR